MCFQLCFAGRLTTLPPAGGKAKPLKAPKKDKKDLDEDEIAFQAKQRAGTYIEIHKRFHD